MKEIKNLLERFKNSLLGDVDKKEKIILVVEEISKIKLKLEEISIKNESLIIGASPTKNNEIKIKEEKIIFYIKEKEGIQVNKILYR